MRKISSEKINYAIFFVVAIVIVSGAIYIENPASLASAIQLDTAQQTPQEDPAGDGDGETNDDNVDTAQQTPQEDPVGDGDGETNDD